MCCGTFPLQSAAPILDILLQPINTGRGEIIYTAVYKSCVTFPLFFSEDTFWQRGIISLVLQI